MGYRKNYYSNNYGFGGGYDRGGRWRSEAWHMDGGANDEGWHQAYCNFCGKETEHGRGSGCVPCGDRVAANRSRSKAKKVFQSDLKANEAIRLDRMAVINIYEDKIGSLPDFLKSLKEQLSKKWNLSAKQIEVGAKVLSSIIDQDIVDRVWSRTAPRNADAELKIGSIVRLNSACDVRIVIGKNCPWSRWDDEFEIRSFVDPGYSNWVRDTKNYVVIK